MTENEIKNTKEWFEDFIKTYALSNQETIEFQKAVACLEEIQQYRAIGTVEDWQKLIKKEAKERRKLEEYFMFGSVEEFKALKEKMEEIYKIAMCEQQATSCEYTRLKSFEMIENILGIH